MTDSWLSYIVSLIVVLLLAITGNGQSTGLRGQVVDELGAVIPGATVTLTPAEGKARSVQSGATGEYSVQSIPHQPESVHC